MIDELTKTAALAKADLNESLARLSKIEAAVGSDLAELRVLNNDATSGDSAIRRTRDGDRERTAPGPRRDDKANEQLLGLLDGRRGGSGPIAGHAQPLAGIAAGVAAAEGRAGRTPNSTRPPCRATCRPRIPLVQAAKQAEEEIGRHLHDELAIAVRGVEGDVRLDRPIAIATLGAQLAEATGRLSRLAEVRAAYANQVAETNSRTRLLERAEQNLADARAAQASAKAASLLSCIDVPRRRHPPGRSQPGHDRPGGDRRRAVAGLRRGVPDCAHAPAGPGAPAENRMVAAAAGNRDHRDRHADLPRPQPILERGLCKRID